MENKRLLLTLIFSLFVISILPMVLATGTVTWVTPLTGEGITGIQGFNITNATGFTQINNCTVYITSSSTATSRVIIADNVSTTRVSIYNDTTYLEDSNDYTLTASCRNQSNDLATNSSITVRVDNDVPDTPTTLSPSANSIDTDGSITFSATVNDSETTGCTLYFPNTQPSSASSYAMTYATTSCTYTLSSIADQSYDYYIRASDGTNTTDSSTIRFNVNRKQSSDYMFQSPEVVDTQSQTNEFSISNLGDSGVTIGIIILVILVVIIGYYIFKK